MRAAAFAAVLAGLILAWPAPAAAEGGQLPLSGPAVGAHDATVVKVGGRYLRVMSGRGVPLAVSDDLHRWTGAGTVFSSSPEWTGTEIVGSTDFWAPDLVQRGGQWRLYYSVSTFGSNRSAIGLAVNDALDPQNPTEGWVDRGPVFQSQRSDPYNAIDAQVATDEAGRDWLVFGSFWTGIKRIALGTDGTLAAGARVEALAQRPDAPDAIEGAYLIRHEGYYYLFASFDFCCKGLRSTYHIRVGRSEHFAGPFLDREGVSMLEGGGSVVKDREGADVGPGHNSVLIDGDQSYLVYHVYDGRYGGMARMRIQKLDWSDGWPVPIP